MVKPLIFFKRYMFMYGSLRSMRCHSYDHNLEHAVGDAFFHHGMAARLQWKRYYSDPCVFQNLEHV